MNDLFRPERTIAEAFRRAPAPGDVPWIQVAPGAPYFVTETKEAWTPIGQNDAISWPDLDGLFRRKDLPSCDAYLGMLAEHGVTCLRLMLEYAQGRHRYLERPIGRMVPAMVQLWDDLFALCARHGLRILLTPYDTFWMWRQWRHHPYNVRNGGSVERRSQWLLSGEARTAIKARLTFAVERWASSGVLFAWDLWNEIHPAHADDDAAGFAEFIHDVSTHVRELETRLFGRAHPQTVSLFGPELVWRPQMGLAEPIFRHPELDFASIHIYEEGTIDAPRNTVDAALAMGRIVRDSLAEICDGRPFLDSEHGPIHTYKDHHRTLPEAFDDEYFRHMQWAHLAAGGAGGGLRWPNRRPHSLTPGMRAAQRAMANFLTLIDWPRFRRTNVSRELRLSSPDAAGVACADPSQAVIWLVRTKSVAKDGRLDPGATPLRTGLYLRALAGARWRATAWDTLEGRPRETFEIDLSSRPEAEFEVPPFRTDLALALRRL